MEFTYNKEYIIVIGSNGSGKTTLIQRFLLPKVPLERRYVLNSSRQQNWKDYVPANHIYKPNLFSLQWFESFLLAFTSNIHNAVLVLDDIDNYRPRDSNIFKTCVINARHQNLGLIISSRRLQDLPIVLYAQAKYIFIGSLISRYNIQYLGSIMDYDEAMKLKSMPQYVFGLYDVQNHQLSFVRLA